jgi:hypothetical protein
MFITMFTRAHHWYLSWARWIQSATSQPISLRYIILQVVSSHQVSQPRFYMHFSSPLLLLSSSSSSFLMTNAQPTIQILGWQNKFLQIPRNFTVLCTKSQGFKLNTKVYNATGLAITWWDHKHANANMSHKQHVHVLKHLHISTVTTEWYTHQFLALWIALSGLQCWAVHRKSLWGKHGKRALPFC